LVKPDSRTIIPANQTVEHILGYAPEEVIGRNTEFLHIDQDKYREFGQRMLSALDREGVFCIELPLRRKDGRIIQCEQTLTEVREDSGQPTLLVSIARDISDRQKAEITLRYSEPRFRELFANMSSAVAVYQAVEEGEGFVFLDANRALERVEPVDKDDLLGQRVSQKFSGVKDFGILDVFQRVWSTGTSERFPLAFYQDQRISGWRENYIYKLPSGEVVAFTTTSRRANRPKRRLSVSGRNCAGWPSDWRRRRSRNGSNLPGNSMIRYAKTCPASALLWKHLNSGPSKSL